MFNRFLALDVETSNSDRSSICQVGWVLFENGRIVSEFSSLVNPNSAFLPRNIQVHGIQPQHVSSAPSLGEIYPQLKEACDGEVVVHHGDFDWQSVCHAAFLEGFEFPDCDWLNTRKASQEAWPLLAPVGTLWGYGVDLVHRRSRRRASLRTSFKSFAKATSSTLLQTSQPEDVAHYLIATPNWIQTPPTPMGTTHVGR